MVNKVDLRKEVGSLDMLIAALADELDREPRHGAHDAASARLYAEMQEALGQLRQERGLRRMWLIALEGSDVVETESRRDSCASAA